MGFIDLVSSNWTARSHVGGKEGVFRLDSLHYAFIMISLPDVTQNVFGLDSVTRRAFLDPTAGLRLEYLLGQITNTVTGELHR